MQTPWGEIAVSDAHVHFFSRRFFEALAGESGRSAADVAEASGWVLPGDDPAELAQAWSAELDRNGVERAALIASTPHDEGSVLAAAAACPSRFYACAMVNPAAAEVSLPAGLDMVCLFPAMHGYDIGDSRALAVLDQAAALGCAVFVHCGVLSVGIRQKLGLRSRFDIRHSNPLALHSIAIRYEGVRFIVPHFGAGYLRESLMLADLCPNVYLDTSSSNRWIRYEGLDLGTVFRRALDVAGAGRLLFGSDSSFFPRGWNYEVFEAQTRALLDLGISDADARLILGENLQRVLAKG
jgi:predicted TIM-barrel fold metal-dependent hydrolase